MTVRELVLLTRFGAFGAAVQTIPEARTLVMGKSPDAEGGPQVVSALEELTVAAGGKEWIQRGLQAFNRALDLAYAPTRSGGPFSDWLRSLLHRSSIRPAPPLEPVPVRVTIDSIP